MSNYTRINVTMPNELAALVRDTMPGLNVSGVLQEALRALIGCEHRTMTCTCCGGRAERRSLEVGALERFYRELIWQLTEPIARCATAEGAARVARDLAAGFGVDVDAVPLPRATKSQRLAAEHDRRADVAIDETAPRPRRRARSTAA